MKSVPKSGSGLLTPALLLDLEKMRANIRRMRNHLSDCGVNLRMHTKTAKNIDIVRECAPEAGIAVSTLAEAEYFLQNGIRDIIYAVGITPNKLERVVSLRNQGADLKITVDNMEMARFLADADLASPLDVILEIDCDGHRCGIAPDAPELLAIAASLKKGGERVAGVLTHSGSAYDLLSPHPDTFKKLAAQECGAVRRAASRLRLAGHACPVVSVGSTPTALFGNDFAGITEVRAGVFPFMDCVMASLGVCGISDIALSTLCSVISVRKDGSIIIDAGWSSLSSDQGRDFAAYGYGLVCDAKGQPIPGLRLSALNQEHGIITPEKGYAARRISPGDNLRILPQHACSTASSFPIFTVISNEWPPAAWSRCQGWQ